VDMCVLLVETTSGTFDREKHERGYRSANEQDPGIWFIC